MNAKMAIRLAAVAACAGLLQIPPASASTYKVLYNFGLTDNDGVAPNSLIAIDNTLYGTTVQGGVSTRCNNLAEPGCGTAFSITTDGKYTTLYSFKGGKDGAGPSYGNLIEVGGTLYGTTLVGGAGGVCGGLGCGTTYSLSRHGKERVLHSFNGTDGYEPNSLIEVNGTIYGTTWLGGAGNCTSVFGVGCGTVFIIAPDGTEANLYTFTGGKDGASPSGGLIYVNGKLYGTTLFGGTGSCTYGGGSGCGTVFSITPDGKEKVLYAFKGGRDGAEPEADVIDVHGIYYGTTYFGGGRWGGGTVFSLVPREGDQVLHEFGYGRHGGSPAAGLLDVNGTLYGTGQTGGKDHSGIVFSITTDGTENVIHEFTSTDGAFPTAPLINVNGTLYGTTIEGGASAQYGGCAGDGGFGCGVVFSIKP